MSSIIKIIVGVFVAVFWCVSNINAQWSSDFSEQDLSEWTGDVDQFIVNEDGQLQLNAPAAGETTLFRQSQISDDTVSIGFYHKLDFSPSDNNRSTIYLALDNQDLSVANGYYLQIGENGSDDAINFYYLNNGTAELIGSATMGAMANEPAEARVDIDVFPSGLWSVKTNYDGLESTFLDVEFMDDRFSFSDSQFFGIKCKFSASRADKFFYGDMFIKAFEVDLTPPNIIEAAALSVNQILIKFDEPVEASDAQNVNHYNVDNGVGNPFSINNLSGIGNEYLLQFATDFASDIVYSMIASGINDLNGNLMTDFSLLFNVPSKPIIGDLLLSEILFDPYIEGEDFIELYNTSDKFIELQGIIISNTHNEMMQVISSNLSIGPKEYIALTEDADFLVQEYKPDSDANIIISELPAFNNDAGNVTITNVDGIVLDSFDYTEDQHFQLIDDTEGVSLERISFNVETNDKRNWQSASQSTRFATPGYKNSGEITINPGDEMFTVVTETFSPDQDGTDDVMLLNYNLEKSGFVANIAMHDAAGFKIKALSQNELLSTQGIITWDGTDTEGNISDLGIYIVVGQVFHPDGDVLSFKKTVVLAGFID
tara:strand:- start:292 stop:2088 length:1797 start_codon:yes stop_codon:yes gene_type:complete